MWDKITEYIIDEFKKSPLLAFISGAGLVMALSGNGLEVFHQIHESSDDDVLEEILTHNTVMQGQINLLIALHTQAIETAQEEDMINPKHLEDDIIRPTLKLMADFDDRLYTESAVNLLLGTAAQESDGGYYLKQSPTGPGLGPYSMEGGDHGTHRSLWQHYLSRPSKEHLREIILGLVPESSVHHHPDGWVYVDDKELIGNLPYATAMARLKYWPAKKPLPDANDIPALGEYWNTVFNANEKYGTVADFVDSWKTFIAIE